MSRRIRHRRKGWTPGVRSPDVDASVAVIAALAIERAPLDVLIAADPQSSIHVYQSGPGHERAYSAARSAISAGASALVSWGVAGALVPELSAGTILLPQQVLTPAGVTLATDLRWRMELYRALQPMFAVRDGSILETPDVLTTRAVKAQAAQASGAIAADMESAAVGQAASDAGKPFVVLRVVLDTLADTLPPGVERWIDEAGNRRRMAAFEMALRPASWPNLIGLSRRYGRARGALAASAQVLVPHGFLYSQPSSAQV